MTPEQQAAYINAMAACATAEIAAMEAENKIREAQGDSPAYGSDAFVGLIEKYGIHHNAIFSFFETT